MLHYLVFKELRVHVDLIRNIKRLETTKQLYDEDKERRERVEEAHQTNINTTNQEIDEDNFFPSEEELAHKAK